MMASDILLIDDHPMVRAGLKAVLARVDDFNVCAEACCVQEALDAVAQYRPHIALVDLQLNDEDGTGMELIPELKHRHPDIRMLVVSMHDENLYAERALRAGAHGYICKNESAAKLIDAMRKVLDGRRYVSDNVTERILAHSTGDKTDSPQSLICTLSDRELQTFDLISEGLTAREIAAKLGVAVKTVNTFRENIKTKLKVDSANRLTRLAIEWKLTGVYTGSSNSSN